MITTYRWQHYGGHRNKMKGAYTCANKVTWRLFEFVRLKYEMSKSHKYIVHCTLYGKSSIVVKSDQIYSSCDSHGSWYIKARLLLCKMQLYPTCCQLQAGGTNCSGCMKMDLPLTMSSAVRMIMLISTRKMKKFHAF